MPVRAPWEAHVPAPEPEPLPDWWTWERPAGDWEMWVGVTGLYYARRLRTSPPVVLWASSPAELRALVI